MIMSRKRGMEGRGERGREEGKASTLPGYGLLSVFDVLDSSRRKERRTREGGRKGRKADTCDWGTERHTRKYKQHAQANALPPSRLTDELTVPRLEKRGCGCGWVSAQPLKPFMSLLLCLSCLASMIHHTTGNKVPVLLLFLHSPGTSASSLPIPSSSTARAAAVVLVLVVL